MNCRENFFVFSQIEFGENAQIVIYINIHIAHCTKVEKMLKLGRKQSFLFGRLL